MLPVHPWRFPLVKRRAGRSPNRDMVCNDRCRPDGGPLMDLFGIQSTAVMDRSFPSIRRVPDLTGADHGVAGNSTADETDLNPSVPIEAPDPGAVISSTNKDTVAGKEMETASQYARLGTSAATADRLDAPNSFWPQIWPPIWPPIWRPMKAAATKEQVPQTLPRPSEPIHAATGTPHGVMEALPGAQKDGIETQTVEQSISSFLIQKRFAQSQLLVQ